MGGQHHTPTALPPVRTWYPLYSRLGGPQSRSGRVRTTLAPTGIRCPDLPFRIASLSGCAISAHYIYIYIYHRLISVFEALNLLIRPTCICKRSFLHYSILPEHTFTYVSKISEQDELKFPLTQQCNSVLPSHHKPANGGFLINILTKFCISYCKMSRLAQGLNQPPFQRVRRVLAPWLKR